MSAEDQEIIQHSKDKSAEWCGLAQSVGEIDREAEKEDLKNGAGTSNFMFEALTGDGGMAEKLQEAMTPDFIISKSFPIALWILCLIFFAFCCWCACCKKCRCGHHERGAPMAAKGVIGVLLLGGVVGWVISIVLILNGLAGVTNGIYSSGCATANFLQDMLAGSDGFIGIVPVTDEFQILVDKLDTGSDFVAALTQVLDQTAEVDVAVEMASRTVTLLQTSLADTDTSPTGPSGYMHTCVMCSQLPEQLSAVVDLLDNGVGTALKDARGQVNQQLTGSKMVELQASIESAIDPLIETKDTMVGTVGWFVTPGGFDAYTPIFQGQTSPLGLMIIYALVVLSGILVCGVASLALWHFKEKKPEPEHGEESLQHPYTTRVPNTARCAWCNGMIFAINMFLIGGLMVILAVPISGVCLFLIELDGALLESSATAFNLDMGEQQGMVIDIIDRCLSLKAEEKYAGQSSNLMDIVKTDKNGTMETIRDQVITTAIKPVEDAFGQITSSLTAVDTPELSSQQALLDIRAALASNEVSKSMLVDVGAVTADNTYKAMMSNPTLAAATMNCDSYTAGDNTVPGIDDFADTLAAMGTGGLKSGTCASYDLSVICAPSQTVCDAGSAFLTSKKNQLGQNGVFQCNLLQNSLGLSCDPKDMTKNTDTGEWENLCVDQAGGITTYPKPCNSLAEYDTYIKNFDLRFEKTFAYLDDIVASKLDHVNTDLRKVVDDGVVNPIYAIVEEFQCNFMRDFWAGLLDGFCYRGANGFRLLANTYVIAAIVGLVLAIAGFIVFRFSQDNIDAWQDREGNEDTKSETI